MRSRWSRVTATLEGIDACVFALLMEGVPDEIETGPMVALDGPAEPVAEGSPVRVTVSLSEAVDEDVTIPLLVSRHTSEAGDHGTLAGITLLAGFTSATGTIATHQDDDTDDEQFIVALGGPLPAGLQPSSATSITVTIADDDASQGQGRQRRSAQSSMAACAAHLPANAVSVSEVTGWRDSHAHVASHVARWNGVLAALGEDVGVAATTVAQSKANEGATCAAAGRG